MFVQVVPLKENGAELDVTEENKMEYLDLLAQHRLARSVKEEIDAFLKGKSVAQANQFHTDHAELAKLQSLLYF